MKRFLIRISLFFLLLSIFICGCIKALTPHEFLDAQSAIDAAYCRDANKECPNEYNKLYAMWEDAQSLYRSGKYQEGLEKAREVRDMANSLCPPPPEEKIKVASKPPKEVPLIPPPIEEVIEEADSDEDGVVDSKDRCPDTPRGIRVDEYGCPLDSDGDGVPDHKDECPRTPKCATVNKVGCWVLANVHFDFDKWDIKPKYQPELDKVVSCIKQYPSIKIEVQGHTDNFGSKEYNKGLSMRRANAVMKYFISKGISSERLSAKGFDFSRPIDTNKTKEGRAMNRRVELKPIF